MSCSECGEETAEVVRWGEALCLRCVLGRERSLDDICNQEREPIWWGS